MQTLRQVIEHYQKEGKALGHFNFSDSTQLKAIVEAAKETGLPVIAGLSERERDFFPLSHARALVDIYRSQGVEIFLNADHTFSIETVQRAIAAGVDSVVVDGAPLSIEDNTRFLTTAVKYARASGRDVIIEGELGYIGQTSKELDALPDGVSEGDLTTVEDAKKFLAETGIDCLAPAVGNVHGMFKNRKEPKLWPERVKEIAAETQVPLVLHGASGNTDEEVRACIKAGIAIVHINTELRVLYRDALRAALKGEETTPYKFLLPVVAKMQEYIALKLRLFAGQ